MNPVRSFKISFNLMGVKEAMNTSKTKFIIQAEI